jgi:polyhydroxybutyrate depolymerase
VTDSSTEALVTGSIRVGVSLCLMVVLACGVSLAAQGESPAATTVDRHITVAGRERGYRLHLPPMADRVKPRPLVLVFHGGGGDPASVERLTRFSELADRDGFIAVYPEGVGKNWNDGRENAYTGAFRDQVDDVAFVSALLDALAAELALDPTRIYATGISNGAIFSSFLAATLSSRIAAIAPVAGSMAVPFDARFAPAQAVSVLMINGTEDPLVPYEGGGVARGRRGKVIGVDAAMRKWAGANGCPGVPQSKGLPDVDPDDGCRGFSVTWTDCRDGAEVILYRLEGGGHTWPGGAPCLPDFIIGKVCKDFDATAAIWEFFDAHPKTSRGAKHE